MSPLPTIGDSDPQAVDMDISIPSCNSEGTTSSAGIPPLYVVVLVLGTLGLLANFGLQLWSIRQSFLQRRSIHQSSLHGEGVSRKSMDRHEPRSCMHCMRHIEDISSYSNSVAMPQMAFTPLNSGVPSASVPRGLITPSTNPAPASSSLDDLTGLDTPNTVPSSFLSRFGEQ
ncbi:hypothetical protein BKA93DRAFT_794976 [Sparassis latifolia]